MTPEVLEIPGTVLLVVVAYAVWRSRQPAAKSGRTAGGKRRDIWDEVEGRVISIAVREEAVYVAYEFLTPRGSQHAEQRFALEASEPYQSGSREGDLAHAAERYIRAYPVGSPARVRYNPKRVSESVLTRPRAQAAPAAAKVAESPAV